MEGKVPGSNSPSVPFQTPENPLSGISPTGADTNYGRATNTEDRKMPVSYVPGNEPNETSPIGGGTCQDLWGYGVK